ncbi:MAG: fatty acid hydroxylase family protein [Deltaproteobacteria bacterium]|nr:MAG: fatty acid hydroxylase family protein [Deltaproteobacteria bacterium]
MVFSPYFAALSIPSWDQLPPWFLYLAGALLSGVLFWAGVAFFELCERRRWLQIYRIQPDQFPEPELLAKAHKQVRWNQTVIQWPFLVAYYFLFLWAGMQFARPFPAWYVIALQFVVFMLIEDTLFYWVHRAFHHRSLFRRFHRLHHDFRVSSAIASQYMHPVEFVAAGLIPTFTAPLVVLGLGWPVHILTFWIWLSLRVLETIDGHCGYNLPLWFPHKIIYGGGSPAHDFHHACNKGNFGSFFHHWDWLCGTSYKNPTRRASKEAKSKS